MKAMLVCGPDCNFPFCEPGCEEVRSGSVDGFRVSAQAGHACVRDIGWRFALAHPRGQMFPCVQRAWFFHAISGVRAFRYPRGDLELIKIRGPRPSS